jgi:hypothetical protein
VIAWAGLLQWASVPPDRRSLLSLPVIYTYVNVMIETNPILAQIADLRARVESLRGYL